MKTTYNWLREYCDFDLSVEDLAHRLSMAGCLIEDVQPLGDDTLLVAEVTANRPDLLGTLGIAREVCALTGSALRLPTVEFACGDEHVESLTSVTVLDPDLCPRYTARVIRGVRVGPSPDWLRRRVEAIGLRAINNVVDVSNYVLFECGQPLHAFDFDRLRGGRIIVRRAEDGETMMSIDETECKLNSSMLVIADADQPVAIAGVMGGLVTEISERTADVLLESARFENTNIRRTSRALGLTSDSSYRFERGVDPVQVEWASRRAAHLIQKVAGGTVCEGVIDLRAEGLVPYKPKQVALRVARMNRVLGTEIPTPTARDILQLLGFEVHPQTKPDEVVVTVPPFRAGDVSREADLIEEVIRIHGYDKIPESSTLYISAGRIGKPEQVEKAARNVLTGLGYNEVLTNSFCDEATAQLISPWTGGEALVVQNTVRRHENRLRVSLMPGLLTVKRTNAAHGVSRSPLFETSRVFLPKPPRDSGEPSRDDALPEERTVLGLLDDDDLRRLKGTIESLLQAVGLGDTVSFEPCQSPFFQAGRSGRILLKGQLLGVLGEVSPTVVERYDLTRAPGVAELDFDLLVKAADLDHVYAKLPTHPAAVRDLCVVVDEAVQWAQMEQCIRKLSLPTLERIEFFDVFRGRQVPQGKKSVAFSLAFRAPDRTLTSEEIEEARHACIKALEAIGATLRG